MSIPDNVNAENTLEPPGAIAILGGGPLAIETALYGRYLGFTVTVISPDPIVSDLQKNPGYPVPVLFTTPLGLAAIAAQRGLGGTMAEFECTNYAAWINEYFLKLCEVDLLRDSVFASVNIDRIALAEVEESDDAEVEEEQNDEQSDLEIPPDFIIEWTDEHSGSRAQRFEAIIDMRSRLQNTLQMEDEQAGWLPEDVVWLGPDADVPPSPPDYYLVLADLPGGSITDAIMAAGFERIRELFARLCDRPNLDVYRNLGGFGR